MRFFLIAMPPPGEFYGGLLIGVMVVSAILWAFLGRNLQFAWRRLLEFCVAAAVIGPLVSAGLAGLAVAFGDVSPLDRWLFMSRFLMVGTFAGIAAAVLIGIIGSIRIAAGRAAASAQPQTPPEADKSGG